MRAELWEELTDSDVFGVELEDGRIAYCCVMGNSGIHKGLGIYVGKRGFRTYLDQINKDNVNDRKVVFDRMATFEDMQVTYDENGTVQWWSHHPHLVPSPENSTELQRLHKAGTLQCRLIHPPTPVKESEDTPGYYPLWLFTVNKGDGRIVQTETVRLGDDMGVYAILSNLCEVDVQARPPAPADFRA